MVGNNKIKNMKIKFLIIIVGLISILTSCNPYTDSNGNGFDNYENFVRSEVNLMNPPVVLIGIEKNEKFGCSITIQDSTGKVFSIGNKSVFATTIGGSRNIGDTIMK